jgi:ATP-binding cassette subfamily B protein
MDKMTEEKDSILSLIKSPYVLSFIKKYKISYIIGIIFLVLIDYLQTKIPLNIGKVIDGLEKNNITLNGIQREVIIIIALATVIIIGRIMWRLLIFGAARKIERDIRDDMFAHLEKLSQKYYNKNKTGEIMAYITNDLEAVRQAMGMGVMMIFDVATLLFFTLYNMVTQINVLLTVFAVIPLMSIALVTAKLGPKLFRRFADRQDSFSKISDFVQEDLSGIKVIKSFVQQEKEIEAFEKINNNYYKVNMSLMRMRAALNPFMSGIAGVAMAIALGYGGYITINGVISVGNFVTFVQFLGMLVWPMMAIGMAVNMMTMGSASLKRIQSVLNEEIEIKDADDVINVEKFEGSIKFDNLNYKYPETDGYALENISFEINKGDTLGIVGRTGSGKTTLVNLLLRLYNVNEKSIFVSGTDIMKLPLKTLRENIGYVPQDNFLFSDTIKNNIDFSNGNLSMATVEEFAEFACVHDNIVEFKDGYETIVGERGVTLSGGQKQRVSIARALIKDPEILILDDSVSAVDTDTEEKILNNLRKQRAGKTNIIIAHRISTIQKADHIIVIDEGKLVEQGTHEQLVANNGLYNSLYQKQLLEKMIDEEA